MTPAAHTKVTTRVLHRMTHAEFRVVDVEKREVQLSWSSEDAIIERYFGNEQLSHEPDAVDLTRLNLGAAFLLNHDTDQHIGAVRKAWIENRRGLAVVKFGRSKLADEALNDVLDEIRTFTSTGYWIHARILLEEPEEGPPVYLVTKWEPLELSLASIPAEARCCSVRSLVSVRARSPLLSRQPGTRSNDGMPAGS